MGLAKGVEYHYKRGLLQVEAMYIRMGLVRRTAQG